MDTEYIHPVSKGSAWSLLTMVHFQQALEAQAGVHAALASLANEEITDEQFIRMVAELEGYPRDLSQMPIYADLQNAATVETGIDRQAGFSPPWQRCGETAGAATGRLRGPWRR